MKYSLVMCTLFSTASLFAALYERRQKEVFGNTPLMLATAKYQAKEVKKLLREGADPHEVNLKGYTALEILATRVARDLRAQQKHAKIQQLLESKLATCNTTQSTQQPVKKDYRK